VIASVGLAAVGCGSGDGEQRNGEPTNGLMPGVTVPSVFPPSSGLAQLCVAPRPAGTINPDTGLAYGDVPASLLEEKGWIRSFVHETYLWPEDVPEVDPTGYVIGATVPFVNPANNAQGHIALASVYDVVKGYFNSQRSPLLTPSGRAKDRYHFTYPTSDWQALERQGNGAGFGFTISLISAGPPRKAVVAYTSPGTPALESGIGRGAAILSVNGVDVIYGNDTATLNEGLFTPVIGKQYSFEVLDQGAATSRTVAMTAGRFYIFPVPNTQTLPPPNETVGYMLFTDHIARAEIGLVLAIKQLKAANGGRGISDLVLDLRYNGGGILNIAAELAYMIAGPGLTAGKVFEKELFSSLNPLGSTAGQVTVPFVDVTQGYSTFPGQPLPYLGLPRVFVITGSGTCSASESIINGLLGAGVEVIQIGGGTCGKPYGFFARENCSTTYFNIQFKGVNDRGFGDYSDGFIPGAPVAAANKLRGCAVADDFSSPLGDPAEARLKSALGFLANGSCPPVASAAMKVAPRVGAGRSTDMLMRPAVLENRFLMDH